MENLVLLTSDSLLSFLRSLTLLRFSRFCFLNWFCRACLVCCRLFHSLACSDEVCTVDRHVRVVVLFPQRLCFFIEWRRQLNPSGFFICLSQTVVDIGRVWIPLDVTLKRGDCFLRITT